MKIVSILIMFLFFLGCKGVGTDPYTNGRIIEASINGKPWENSKLRVDFLRNCTSSIDLLIQISNSQGFNRETFSMSKIPLHSGVFEIKKHIYTGSVCLEDSLLSTKKVDGFYSTSQDDGDVGKDVYYVLENNRENNKLTIDKYNSGGVKFISGEFNVTLLLVRKKDGTKKYFDSVDTIRITKARFEASGF